MVTVSMFILHTRTYARIYTYKHYLPILIDLFFLSIYMRYTFLKKQYHVAMLLSFYILLLWYSYLTPVCSVNEEETACLTFVKICFFLLAPQKMTALPLLSSSSFSCRLLDVSAWEQKTSYPHFHTNINLHDFHSMRRNFQLKGQYIK